MQSLPIVFPRPHPLWHYGFPRRSIDAYLVLAKKVLQQEGSNVPQNESLPHIIAIQSQSDPTMSNEVDLLSWAHNYLERKIAELTKSKRPITMHAYIVDVEEDDVEDAPPEPRSFSVFSVAQMRAETKDGLDINAVITTEMRPVREVLETWFGKGDWFKDLDVEDDIVRGLPHASAHACSHFCLLQRTRTRNVIEAQKAQELEDLLAELEEAERRG